METAFDPAIVDYLTFAVGTLAASALGFAIAWLRTRERAIRAEARLEQARPSTLAEARFDRIDGAIDAMTVELERIAEAERFTTKVLAGRGAAPRRPDDGRVITPH